MLKFNSKGLTLPQITTLREMQHSGPQRIEQKRTAAKLLELGLIVLVKKPDIYAAKEKRP